MTKQQTIISCYYFLTILVLAASVVRAVITGGAHVSFGRDVAVRQTEKQVLLDKKATLERQIASAQSLTTINPLLASGEYVSLEQPIQISLDTSLASR